MDFLSPSITLTLGLTGIVCDCKIRKLLEDVESGRVVIGNSKWPSKCTDGTLLTSVKPENLVCNEPFQEPTCIEYYTSTPSPATDPVTKPVNAQLKIQVVEVGTNYIKASWSLTNHADLQKFKFEVTSSNSVVEFTRSNIGTSVDTYTAPNLPPNTYVTVCVTASFFNKGSIHDCSVNKTGSTTVPDKKGLNDSDSDSATTGIIVGCVVAGVALIGIVIAIVVLLVCRKKPKDMPDSYRPPTQPRSFAKAELPSMSGESRTFAKPKKNGKGHHPGNMQVVAISDGQTSPGHRVGRVNMMFKPEEGYEPMSNFKKPNNGSVYENDHGALPPTPGPDQDSRPPSYPGATGGYYNQGYNEDKYDEIEVEI